MSFNYLLIDIQSFKNLVDVPDFMREHESVVTMKNFGEMMEDFFVALFDEIIEFKEKYQKPIILTCYNTREEKFVTYLQDHGIPVYYPEEGVWTLIRMWQYTKFLKSKNK